TRQDRNGAEQNQAENRDPDQGAEGQRRVHAALRSDDHVAEAVLGSDELAHDRADDGSRRGHLQGTQDIGIGVGYADLGEHLPFGRVEDAAEVEHVVVDLRQPDGRIDDDGKEADQRADQHVRQYSVAEPEQEQGRDRHLGERVDEDQERHQRPAHHTRPGDDGAKRDAADRGNEERAENRNAGDDDVPGPVDLRGQERVQDGGGARQEIFAHAENGHGNLPQYNQRGEQEERREPFEELVGNLSQASPLQRFCAPSPRQSRRRDRARGALSPGRRPSRRALRGRGFRYIAGR